MGTFSRHLAIFGFMVLISSNVSASESMTPTLFLKQSGFDKLVVEMLSKLGVPKDQHESIAANASSLMAGEISKSYSEKELAAISSQSKQNVPDNDFTKWFEANFISVLNEAFQQYSKSQSSNNSGMQLKNYIGQSVDDA